MEFSIHIKQYATVLTPHTLTRWNNMETHYPTTLTRQQHHQQTTVRRPYGHGEGGGGGGGVGGGPSPLVEIPKQPSHSPSDGDRSTGGELRAAAALDCNLNSLCDHIQLEGFNNGVFSDVIVHAMGSTYHLHRLILSRSSYFRSFLVGFADFFLT